MKKPIALLLACTATLWLEPLHAQDSDPAAERARLANQRIQAELERQAREEALRREAEARALKEQQAALRASGGGAPPGTGDMPSMTMSGADSGQGTATRGAALDRVLEQLRTLGELKDSGYVTEEEFERIKRRIMEGEF